MSKTLAIGMTVGLRVNKQITYDYCTQALHSLRKAGFTQPVHLFVEPGAEIHIPEGVSNLVIHKNKRKFGCFPNFRRGLRILRDETEASWLLMVQDDAVWRANGYSAIEKAINDPTMQDIGFLSPYTSKAMVSQSDKQTFAKGKKQRWVNAHFHNKAFWGAVAMCFPRASANALEEESQRYRNHKHHRKLDVVVGNAMRRELNLRILVHIPSLVDHVGSWSTLGRHRLKGNQWGRRGYGFKVK